MKLAPKAQNLTDDTWYYEEPTHIDIIVWLKGNVTHVKIPHRKLIATLKRAGKLGKK